LLIANAGNRGQRSLPKTAANGANLNTRHVHSVYGPDLASIQAITARLCELLGSRNFCFVREFV